MVDSSASTNLKETARALKQQGDLDGAATALHTAIDLTATELADLYGMLGGVLRAKNDLVASAQAYDAGFELEQKFNMPSTYNRFNRLMARVQLCPGALTDPGLLRAYEALPYVDVSQLLTELEATLHHDVIGPRSTDYWAAGDLVVVAALNGHLVEATEALDAFAGHLPAPPEPAWSAYAATLQALAALDTPRTDILSDVRARLLQRKG